MRTAANPVFIAYEQANALFTYRLFPTTSGPASSIAFGGVLVQGTGFEVTQAGMFLQGYWWWRADSAQSASANFATWQITGSATATLIAATVTSTTTAAIGQWNYTALTPQVALAANTPYRAVVGVSGNFPSTSNQFGTTQPFQNGITQGPLFAYSDQSGTAPIPFANAWIDVQVVT